MAEPAPGATRWTGVTDRPLSLGAVHRFLRDERAGGTCVFVGSVRRWTEGHETARLSYESYRPLADRELDALAATAGDRWEALRVVALHRLGDVDPPEPGVVVGLACAHRAGAFAGARWLIDAIKESVPIWKTDHAR